ncbi:MAG: transporter substrate-binding domain-containing protein [Pseudomonadales bacterium]|nr:transporter substrate-binding domain-containing protein [Pseudomonadales bacterium]NRA18700.1 amino acid ABC transporter substrate-binding protein [Oceanospirillaceae bacterium]
MLLGAMTRILQTEGFTVESKFKLLKKPWFSSAVIASVFLLSAPTSFAAEEHSCKSVKINGSSRWYPFSYRDSSNNLTGIAYQVAETLFKRLKIDLTVDEPQPWKRTIMGLKYGRLDILSGAYWDVQRAENYDFSIPFSSDEVRLFVRNDSLVKYPDLIALRGTTGSKPIGISLGRVFEENLKSHVKVIEPVSYESMIKMVYLGRVEWFGLGLYNGQKLLKDLGYEDEISPLPYSIETTPVHFMLSKNSNCSSLLKRVNAGLEALIKEGVIEEIIEKETQNLILIN